MFLIRRQKILLCRKIFARTSEELRKIEIIYFVIIISRNLEIYIYIYTRVFRRASILH